MAHDVPAGISMASEPTEPELNRSVSIPSSEAIRRRLSDMSWWMRLLCQPLAARANRSAGFLRRFGPLQFAMKPRC
jgi:hypothetical protein